MPRKKQDQPQRLGLQSHGDTAPAADTVTVNPVDEEMSVSDTERGTHPSSPKPPPSLTPPTPLDPTLTPTPTSSSTPRTSTAAPNPLDHNSTPTPTSSSMVPQDGGLGLSQGPIDNPLDKDQSLSSILALLCGGNPLQGLGRELATSPPCALEPGVTTLGGVGRMKGGRGGGGGREGDSSPPLGLLPDVPPLSQHALQLSALAQRGLPGEAVRAGCVAQPRVLLGGVLQEVQGMQEGLCLTLDSFPSPLSAASSASSTPHCPVPEGQTSESQLTEQSSSR
ncbi:hypothetical protein J4Q44_G00374120 [Coregonus suidteri]|uniref:Uncharacterized protein n=1 Tax=Coregonus suidteri TaxID=861788 RepID=A0AAN8KJ59_9TELE